MEGTEQFPPRKPIPTYSEKDVTTSRADPVDGNEAQHSPPAAVRSVLASTPLKNRTNLKRILGIIALIVVIVVAVGAGVGVSKGKRAKSSKIHQSSSTSSGSSGSSSGTDSSSNDSGSSSGSGSSDNGTYCPTISNSMCANSYDCYSSGAYIGLLCYVYCDGYSYCADGPFTY